jgi:hypothetical protein
MWSRFLKRIQNCGIYYTYNPNKDIAEPIIPPRADYDGLLDNEGPYQNPSKRFCNAKLEVKEGTENIGNIGLQQIVVNVRP